MHPTGYVLGLDAGTTKTVALVATLEGGVVGSGRGGDGNMYDRPGADPAIAEVERAVEAALSASGISRDELSVGTFSMSGADWPEDFDFLHAEMDCRGFGRRILIVNDAIGGLRAGSPDGTGVAAVCGTGGAVGARAPDGRVWHTSFWQEVGGSHDLARRALSAVYRAALEIDPPTSLTARALDLFGQSSVEDVLHLLTARIGAPRAPMGALARALLDEADAGDHTARCIVQEHGVMFGDYAKVAARRVGLEGSPFTLVLAGGVLRHSATLLADSIVKRVRTSSPEVRPVTTRFEPAVGALLLALEAADVTIDEPLLSRLVSSLPLPSLFET